MKEGRVVPLRYDGVIFDMDGTLIEPLLDFPAIRAELGVRADEGVLEALDARDPPAAQAGHAWLLEQELAAARRARLLPGARELLAALAQAGLKTALLTRNCRQAMRTVLDRFALRFDLAWSRENGPIKPEPVGVLRACDRLGLTPARTLCVGDFHYDLQAASAAGADSALLVHGQAPPPFAEEATYVVRALSELGEILGLDGMGGANDQ